MRATDHIRRLLNDHKRHHVAEENSRQKHEAQLSSGRLDDGSLIVLDEDEDYPDGEDDAEAGERHGGKRDAAVVAEVDLGDLAAVAEVRGGDGPRGALHAPVGRGQVLVRVTRDAGPAALVALHVGLGLDGAARLAAHGLGVPGLIRGERQFRHIHLKQKNPHRIHRL